MFDQFKQISVVIIEHYILTLLDGLLKLLLNPHD